MCAKITEVRFMQLLVPANCFLFHAHVLRSNPTITYKVKSLLSNVVLSQQTENPLTCRMQLCSIHPDEHNPEFFPKQKEDILAQMLHTHTRYTATFSFKSISLNDCAIAGIPLPILLMSKEHHNDKNIKWHCIDSLQPGSRGGNRCWAQCNTRHMNDFEVWLKDDLQEAAYTFLTKVPDDRDTCAVSAGIISSDDSRREGPLLLPPAKSDPSTQNLSSIHNAIASLTATVNNLAKTNGSAPSSPGLHVETQNQLNEMQSAIAEIARKVSNLKIQSTPKPNTRSETKLTDEIKGLANKVDKIGSKINGAITEITKGIRNEKRRSLLKSTLQSGPTVSLTCASSPPLWATTPQCPSSHMAASKP